MPPHARAEISRRDSYQGDIRVKSYDWDDKHRVFCAHEYTLKPWSDTWVEAGPGPRVQLKCAGVIWFMEDDAKDPLPDVCFITLLLHFVLVSVCDSCPKVGVPACPLVTPPPHTHTHTHAFTHVPVRTQDYV
jgi:hypothetical protein